MNLTSHEHLTRQMDIIPGETLGMPVHIIGCGAIGSFLGLSLAKMGLKNISAYDMDSVSIENMSNQFFRYSDIGKNKALALYELVKDFTGVNIQAYNREFMASDASRLNGLVVVAVDSMEARRMIYEAIQESGYAVKFIIDPRMSAEFYAQYTINPFLDADKKTYDKTLYTDNEAVAERCTAKSTIYTATLAAGLVCKTIKDLITKAELYPRTIQWAISAAQDPMVMFPGNARGPLLGRQMGTRQDFGQIATYGQSINQLSVQQVGGQYEVSLRPLMTEETDIPDIPF